MTRPVSLFAALSMTIIATGSPWAVLGVLLLGLGMLLVAPTARGSGGRGGRR